VGRWRPLRGDLPAEVVRLVRELRQYVDRCELNAATVATKTGYSRSSWLRYLNGRRLPPWPAAAGLGRLAQADPEHLRVLWESAAHAWTRETRESPAADIGPSGARGPTRTPVPGPSPAAARPPHPCLPGGPDAAPPTEPRPAAVRPARRLPGGAGTLTAVAAACAMLAALLLARPWDGWTQAGRPDGAPSAAAAWPWPLDDAQDLVAAACRAGGCRGLDPYREKCDRDSVAVHRLRAYGRALTLRYSPACGASWAEVDVPAATAGLLISTTGGDEQPAAAGGAYTAMVGGGPDAARATVVVRGHQLGVARYESWVDDVSGSG
jgi:hypothetical protein